jgi:two-component system, response regulator RegA
MNPIEARNDPPRLLIADDDETLCGVLSRALENRGFSVSVAHDYQSALERAEGHAPEFAVLDLKLGEASGLHLMSKLLERHAGMRVVVLTGYASIATAIEAVKLGAHHYLTKPANADEVVAALRAENGAPSCSCPISERPLSVNRLEWEHINRVLAGNNWNISATARVLGMHRRTLQRKLAKHPARH